MALAKENAFDGYLSAASISDIFYIVLKDYSMSKYLTVPDVRQLNVRFHEEYQHYAWAKLHDDHPDVLVLEDFRVDDLPESQLFGVYGGLSSG